MTVTRRTGRLYGRGKALVGVVLAGMLLASVAEAAVLRVNAASIVASPNGLTWDAAYPVVQPAVDAAASGDEIWVAAGTYTGAGDQVVNLKDGVTLYGGFAGMETVREQRNRTANPTVIDGQGARRCITGTGSSTIDGFTIQNGSATYGAGLLNSAATDCNFTGNQASIYGGGMYGNVATRCAFSKNFGGGGGGGLYGVEANDCTFTENSAVGFHGGAGGGMYGGKATGCFFSKNSAHGGGGTFDCAAANCAFSENEVVTAYTMASLIAGEGGGMKGGSAANCTFIGNVAKPLSLGTESLGGNGGAADDVTAVNCVFSRNSARQGGAAFDCQAVNCTFYGNTATVTDGAGGMSGGATVNCILWGNSPIDAVSTGASYSCLGNPTAGEGNITADPLFVNAEAGVFQLQLNSPCMDTGTAANAPSTDLLGRARPEGAGFDMGAYEYDADALATLVLRVNAASTSAHPDGLAWDTAFPSLQAAAYQGGYGAEIWVAKGTHTIDTGGEVARLMPGTLLFGGFAGTESFRNQRDWKANPTVIDGQGARRCVSANATSIVDGFTLQNGRANGGAGMLQGKAVNCVLSANVAEDGMGGGLNDGTAVNCTFTGNTAMGGGAGANAVTAVNCVFFGNAGTGLTSGDAFNCSFVGNGSGMGYGTAVNCIFWGNRFAEVGSATVEVSYSCLSAPVEGTGNVVANPLFVNPRAGDLRLRAGSPCIDAGTASGAPAMDILGRARPHGAGIDMGAYEYYAGDDANPVDAAILRVNATSTAANPAGLSWETALPTLQAAADRSGYGGEIWVAGGTYTSEEGAVVKLPPLTMVFGGFLGVETSREQRDWAANPTIIDGQGARQCVSSTDSNIVDGLTIQNGKSNYGAGLAYGSAANCTFVGNAALAGGGMYGVQATNCTFSGNSAIGIGVHEGHGGGMYGGRASHCVFSGNRSRLGGGTSDCIATDCTFSENVADAIPFGPDESFGGYGGGMYAGTAVNCTFLGNTVTALLHGEVTVGGRGGAAANVAATNCTFYGNTGHSSGGMYEGTAVNCIIWGNSPAEVESASVTHSCLSKATPGEGNIAADPLFADAAAGDLRLQSGSPCINTGTSNGASSTDILGVARPQGPTCDMGAYEFPYVAVPDLSGLARYVAEQALGAARLRVGETTEEYNIVLPAGAVIRQAPAAGIHVPQATQVNLVLSRGGTAVPNVTGRTRGEAAAAIIESALAVGIVTEQYSPEVPAGAVVSQSPVAGTPVLPGASIDLVVSRGVQPSVVPNVVGQPQAQAERAVTGAGLVVNATTRVYDDTVPEGIVVSQSPAAGTELPLGMGVSIVVSLGAIPMAEGEGEPPLDIDAARQQLAENYGHSDANGDGRLSFNEATGAISGLTQAVFDALDTNGDGQLSPEELGMNNGFGCSGCKGTTIKSAGDGIAFLFGSLGLVATAGVKWL